MKTLVILIAIFLMACTAFVVRSLPPVPSQLTIINLDESFQGNDAAWERQIEKVYPAAVVVFAHGGDVDGQWALHPDHFAKNEEGEVELVWDKVILVHDEIAKLHHMYPGRTIVLISCNPSHHLLHGEHGVVYADREVWVTPDSDAPHLRLEMNPDDGVGDIHEFIHQE